MIWVPGESPACVVDDSTRSTYLIIGIVCSRMELDNYVDRQVSWGNNVFSALEHVLYMVKAHPQNLLLEMAGKITIPNLNDSDQRLDTCMQSKDFFIVFKLLQY